MTHCSEPTSELVSVVIPTYRGDRFIDGALASIAAQSWTNWEVIVVEDGSTGETESLVRRFAGEHPQRRIEYLRHAQNQSQSAARNTGIAAARGQYIALLDVDDRWQPDHLAASLAALRQEKADVAYSTVAMFDDQSDLIIATWGPSAKDLAGFPGSLMGRSFIVPSATVLRREVFARVGLFEPELSPCEDLDYWIRAAEAGARFTHLKGCHVLYRKNHTEAETRGTCRLTEKFARVLDKHFLTFGKGEHKYRKLAARYYFGAAWCHISTRRDQDPTADPSRAPGLLMRAAEIHRGNVHYRLHGLLIRGCNWLRSDLLKRLYFAWFRPRKFVRIGNLMAPPAH
jgi:glycosyltransferase involved in cell wall biosynthesis